MTSTQKIKNQLLPTRKLNQCLLQRAIHYWCRKTGKSRSSVTKQNPLFGFEANNLYPVDHAKHLN